MAELLSTKQVTRKLDRDRCIIEAAVGRFGPISRVQLHHLTKMRRTTISLLVRQLLEEGKLLEAGHADNRLGKKQILLRLNPEDGYIVAIEFDDEFVLAAILDLSSQIKHLVRERTQLRRSPGLGPATPALRAPSLTRGRSEDELSNRVGIADPGFVDSRHGVTLTSSTIDFWENVPLKQVFEEEFGVAAEVESKNSRKSHRRADAGGG